MERCIICHAGMCVLWIYMTCIRDRRGEKWELVSQWVEASFFLQSLTSAGVWVIGPTSLWEICCALFMLLVDTRFKLLISCWFQITGSIQKCLIAICLIQEVQTSSESLECCFLYWGWQSRDQGLESAMCTEYSYELLQ